MKSRHYVALSLGPKGLNGCRAVRDGRRSFRIERCAFKEWEKPVTQDLAERTDEIRRFIDDLRGPEGKTTGIFCLHPSWLLVQKVGIPPVGKKAVREFLALQVERRQSVLRNGGLVWNYLSLPPATGSEGREALLAMAKAETVRPVVDAFRASGASASFATVSSLSLQAALRRRAGLPTDASRVAVNVEERGASVVRIRAGQPVDCGWIAFDPSEKDPLARYTLLSLRIAEQAADMGGLPAILLTGDEPGRSALKDHLSSRGSVEEVDLDGALDGITYATDLPSGESGHLPAELAGLLLEQTEGRAGRLNLVGSVFGMPVWADNLAFLFEKKKAIPLAVAVLLLFMITSYATGRFESALYGRSLDKSSQVATAVDANRENIRILERYSRERISMLDSLLDLSRNLPEGVLLTDLSIDANGRVRLSGKAGAYAQVEEIVAKLNRSDRFANAAPERMSAKEQGGVTFSVKCTLKSAAGRRPK